MMSEKLQSKDDVLNNIFSLWKPQSSEETVHLNDAEGRILLKDLYSNNSIPVVRSSEMDGIGVRYNDFATGMPDTSKWILNIDYCIADTGDDFDNKFDTVIIIEDVKFLKSGGIDITPGQPKHLGQYIARSGEFLKKNELLVKSGSVITALHLNILASGGHDFISVARRPKLIYIPTGSELVPAGTVPSRGENIESNGFMVKSIVEKWGGDVVIYPICKDIKTDLKSALKKAVDEGDMVLINGGTSKGSEDYNADIIKELSSWSTHGVKLAPGKSASVGIMNNIPIVNSPGPPIPNFCVLNWCIRPMIYAYMGIPAPDPPYTYAALDTDLSIDMEMERYQLLKLSSKDNYIVAKPLTTKKSTTRTFMNCNGFAQLEIGKTYHKGDFIKAQWIL